MSLLGTSHFCRGGFPFWGLGYSFLGGSLRVGFSRVGALPFSWERVNSRGGGGPDLSLLDVGYGSHKFHLQWGGLC